MRKEKEQTASVVWIEKDDNILAFCPKCDNALFKGNLKSSINVRVMEERIMDHLDFFSGTHPVDIVHLRRRRNQVVGTGQFFPAVFYAEKGKGPDGSRPV